jgi:hypothetical protein
MFVDEANAAADCDLILPHSQLNFLCLTCLAETDYLDKALVAGALSQEAYDALRGEVEDWKLTYGRLNVWPNRVMTLNNPQGTVGLHLT